MAQTESDRTIEDQCPSCGAMVRRGMVRCWSCGEFMRQDIAAAYQRMQQKQPAVEFRPLPEQTSSRTVEAQSSSATKPAGGNADFEMPGATFSPGGDDFELGAEFAPVAADSRSVSAAPDFTARGRDIAEPVATPAAQPASEVLKPASESKPASETKSAGEAKPVGDGAAKPAAASEAPGPRATAGGDETAHSEATAGDALLQVALQEEAESQKRGRGRAGRHDWDAAIVQGGWMITCPCPARARIKIKEQHRGRTGKCPNPNCGSVFTIPSDLPMPDAAPAAATDAPASGYPADPADKAGNYTHWLRDVRLHAVKPAKAKRKPGGHEKDFQPADIGFSAAAGLLVMSLTVKSTSMVSLSKKKPEQVRDELLADLRAGKPVADLAAESKFVFPADTLGKLIVEYPPAYEHESTFAGIPVFGEGRVAVKLPPGPAPDELHFVSLTLSQYRRLNELLGGLFEVEGLGLGCPIPTDDETVSLVCHYSENPLTILRQPVFHQADPAIELEAVGYRCESCGLIVSEESRKKEKIGGLDGKKLSSAKCPKCKGKFGNTPLYAIKPQQAPVEAAE